MTIYFNFVINEVFDDECCFDWFLTTEIAIFPAILFSSFYICNQRRRC